MDVFKVREEILSVLNNIDALQEELKDIKNAAYEGYKDDAEALEQQIDVYEDTIESLDWDLSEIVQEIVKDIQNLNCMADAYGRQKGEFAAKERWARERVIREKDMIAWIMRSYGERKVPTELWNVSLQKNGGLKGIELKCTPDRLPDRFRIEKKEYLLDSIEARKALDAGETDLPFYYKPQGEHIVIR